jgi:predicted metalloprotease with PDZ domain
MTEDGARPYEWSDIQAALDSIEPNDWAEFHRRFIHGTDPLPLNDTFSRLGLVMSQEDDDGAVRIGVDPDVSEAAPGLLREVLGKNR